MSTSADVTLTLPVVVLSGPSGSGKTTIVHRLLTECPVKLIKSISATTRAPRKGEIDGEHYYFLSPEEFARKRQNGEFLECFEVHGTGNWYGTLRSEVARAVREGGWSLLEIDVQGAQKVISEFPNAISIFLRTSSEDEYERRLRSRGTESEEAIQRRLSNAREELKWVHHYQFQVINDNLDEAVREICQILSNRK
ncbi:MAG: guanylate kinase [Planctomycetales bacterium]